MQDDKSDRKRGTSLREIVERRIYEAPLAGEGLANDKLLDLLHEIEVHQIELERQCEELERDRLELETSRKKYLELYDLAPIAHVTLDRAGLIQEINLTGAELLGTERRRLKGTRFASFVVESDRDNFNRFCRGLFDRGKRHEVEVTIGHGNRPRLEVLLSGAALRGGESRSDLCQVAITDITARKKAESWRRKLIETTQDGVVAIDRDALIMLFNPAAERMFCYTAEEVAGRNVKMLIPDPYASEHDRHIVDCYERTGENPAIGNILTVVGRRKNGEIFPIELSITKIEVGHEFRYVAFIRDISEKAHLQAQLVERARLASIDETTAMLVHEIANPLNGLSMSIQLLERRLGEASDESVTATLRRVGNEVSRLKSLLYDYRSLSKVDSYDLRPASIPNIIEELCAVEKPRIVAKGIQVQLEMDRDLPAVLADREKIKQVLLNLCKNAEEAMTEGGTLTLHAHESGGKIILEVRDTGIGIPSNFNLFEPFKTTKPLGTGLGLIIVRHIVSRHQGSLSYTSEPGRGTSFFVALPIHSPATLG